MTLVENTFYQSLFLFQQEQIPGFVHVFKWTIPNLANHVRDQRTIAFRSAPLQIDNRFFSCIYVVRHNETGRTARRSHGIYLKICEGSIPVFVFRLVSSNPMLVTYVVSQRQAIQIIEISYF